MVQSAGKQRLVVFTVLIGAKEALNNPVQLVGPTASTDLAIDFVCFTDQEHPDSPIWSARRFERGLIPPEKASRYPKANPHLFFADYEYSLYIDNTVTFKRLPQAADLDGALFRAFRHPWRSNPLDEADVVAKSGLDDAGVVAHQMLAYSRRPAFAGLARLTAGTVLLRRHNDERLRRFGEMWWEQILLYSKRDQLSLDLCAEEAGCPVDYFPGDKRNNDLFLWPVVAGNARRVLGSFDAGRYAWQHRADPSALANPREHFLNSTAEAIEFDRRVDYFRYVCLRNQSSLAEDIAPRRSLCESIEYALGTRREPPRTILLAGIRSEGVYSVESSELTSGALAFKQYFRFTGEPYVVNALVGQGELTDPAPFRAAGGQSSFDLILVLGAPLASHAVLLPKFLPLMHEDSQMLVEFSESLSLSQIEVMHAAVGKQGTVGIFQGHHIGRRAAIPSSVVLFQRPDGTIHQPALGAAE